MQYMTFARWCLAGKNTGTSAPLSTWLPFALVRINVVCRHFPVVHFFAHCIHDHYPNCEGTIAALGIDSSRVQSGRIVALRSRQPGNLARKHRQTQEVGWDAKGAENNAQNAPKTFPKTQDVNDFNDHLRFQEQSNYDMDGSNHWGRSLIPKQSRCKKMQQKWNVFQSQLTKAARFQGTE